MTIPTIKERAIKSFSPDLPKVPEAMARVDHKTLLREYMDEHAHDRAEWIQSHKYYYRLIRNMHEYIVPEQSSVLEIGCGTGNLMAALKSARGVGIDFSSKMVDEARKRHPELEFHVADIEKDELPDLGAFDVIILSDVVSTFGDIQRTINSLHQYCHRDTRLVIHYPNFLWQPLIKLWERLGWKMRGFVRNWLPQPDLVNMLELSGFEKVTQGNYGILPLGVPVIAPLCNRILARLPFFRKLSMGNYVVARVDPVRLEDLSSELSVSVLVPCKDEKGNIKDAIERTPDMGKWTELIFIDGNSTDGTADEIKAQIAAHPNRRIKFLTQGDTTGKGAACRIGYEAAEGDVLMILDADLTVSPEDLPKFFHAIASGQGEFINGSRLVYDMENQAMRPLNTIGNKFFSMVFSFLLEQRIRDTLCGTKVLTKRNYEMLKKGRSYFGDFDPFGDFDLLFGASKLHLKIKELPIRYRARTYGDTSISRWRHGWLLLKMSVFSLFKMKFRK